MPRRLLGLIFGAFLALPLAANAAMWNFGGALNADQETHPLVLPSPYFGGGILIASLDDVSGAFVLDVLFSGLTGPVAAGHIHGPALPGVAAPILVDLGLPTVFVPGIFAYHFTLGLDAAAIAMLTTGGTAGVGTPTPLYVNIHTPSNTAGEIRGQLFVTASPVPVPPAVWLMGSAVLGLLSVRRRV